MTDGGCYSWPVQVLCVAGNLTSEADSAMAPANFFQHRLEAASAFTEIIILIV